MKHIHHIIPKHMGGSDDPSNLYECSVAQHAELHFALYLEHGRAEDYFAALSLSNQLDDERQMARSILGGKKSRNNNAVRTDDWKNNLKKSHQGKHSYLNKYKTSEEQRRRARLANLKRWGRRDILSPAGPKIGFD